jgi:hypothetical protein
LVGDAAHGDRDVGCQDGVTKVACDAAHGDGDVGCQDGVTKVAYMEMGTPVARMTPRN